VCLGLPRASRERRKRIFSRRRKARVRPLLKLRKVPIEAPHAGLVESRRWCRTFLRGHSKSFYLATRFLPKAKREAAEATYALFRVVDEIADDPALDASVRHLKLNEIEYAVRHLKDIAYSCEAPWFPAVRAACGKFPIATSDVTRLIEACRVETRYLRFETMDELQAFAARIGGAVMRLAVPILGASDTVSLESATNIGIGLHLIDVVRDVEEDRQLGRSYLPQEYCDIPDRGVKNVAQRARALCAESAVLARSLPNDGSRLMLILTVDLYQALLDGPLSRPKILQHVVRATLKSYAVNFKPV
jgi:phytoene/squalene synthetase